jgi:hypothetical protein
METSNGTLNGAFYIYYAFILNRTIIKLKDDGYAKGTIYLRFVHNAQV